jgi:hypothetical protein
LSGYEVPPSPRAAEARPPLPLASRHPIEKYTMVLPSCSSLSPRPKKLGNGTLSFAPSLRYLFTAPDGTDD